jgi:8-oxo-dGTP diphosphatase
MKKGQDYIGVGVCFMCHDGNGNFLFAKRGAKARDEQGKWEVPAGGIEIGETIMDALKRELREELCVVEPKKVEYIGHEEFIRTIDDVRRHWITFSYLIEVDPSAVAIGEPEMCDALTWAPLNAPPTPAHPATPDSIALAEKYLKDKK